MDKCAYIFLERNFKKGDGKASPPVGVLRDWLYNLFVLPKVEKELDLRGEKIQREKGQQELDARLDKGEVDCLVHVAGKWAYGRRLRPDTTSPDPAVRAGDRKATLTMYVVFGVEPLFSGVYKEEFVNYVDACFERAKEIVYEGCDSRLAVVMPKGLCKVR